MRNRLTDSYSRWLSQVEVFSEDDIECLDPAKLENSSSIWLLQTIEGLSSILDLLFPKINADYLIWNESECNACVGVHAGGVARIFVAEGCADAFLKWAHQLHEQLLPQIDNPIESALLEMWALPRKAADPDLSTSMGSEAYSTTALACLLAHELGHVHEGQFKHQYHLIKVKDNRQALINHAEEFSADWWSVWAAADVLRPFIDLALNIKSSIDPKWPCHYLLSTLALAAFACVEPISFERKWTASNASDVDDTHPVAIARLLSAAVALVDWWIERRGEPPEKVLPMVVTALQRILSASQHAGLNRQCTDSGGGKNLESNSAELLAKLIREHDAAKPYLDAVRQAYPQP